jgi:hypothetical protein
LIELIEEAEKLTSVIAFTFRVDPPALLEFIY